MMKKFKVVVTNGWDKRSYNKGSCAFKHEHIVRATSKRALVTRLKNAEIINGREQVHIEEVPNEIK